MTRLLIISLAMVLYSGVLNGQNLLANGSFENYTLLPNAYGQYDRCVGWSNLGGSATPDYFHTSGSVPTYFGQITPYDGDGQMGIYTYHGALTNTREYVSTQLTSPLVVGQSYQLSFYLTNGFNGGYAGGADNFGVHLSTTPLTQTTNSVVVLTPQFEIPGVVYNSNFWQQYTFTFVASSASEYITFGNFELDATTTITGGTRAYYFIDDIELIPLTVTIQAQYNDTICEGDSSLMTAWNSSTYAWADSLNPTNIISTDSFLTVSPPVTTTYLVFGSNNDTASVTITVDPIPTVDLGNDTTLCTGENLVLDVTAPGASYLWQDNTANSTFTVNSAGTYSVMLTNSGCSAADTINVNYLPAPNFTLGNDTTLCQGETLLLDATVPAGSYLWEDNSTGPTHLVVTAGTYTVNVTSGGCSSDDTINVSYTTNPLVNLGPDTTLCFGDPYQLDATVGGATYLWQDNSTNPTFSPVAAGTYWVEATVNGCSASDTVAISFDPIPLVDLGNDTTLCQGDSLTLDVTIPGSTYLWQDNSTNSTLMALSSGTYSVDVTYNGCTASDSIDVVYIPIPNVNLGPDTSICQGDSILLDATTTGASYLWQDNSTGATLTVGSAGSYSVAVDVSGCPANDTIIIQIDPIPIVDLGNDTSICAGASLPLNASVPGGTYLWQDNSTASLFNATSAGLYHVSVSIGNCQVSDSIIVGIIDPDADLGNDTVLCENQTLVLDATTTGGSYLWQNSSTAATYTVTTAGNYFVVLSVSGCIDTDTISVGYKTKPLVSLGADSIACLGDVVILNATYPNSTYLWQDNSVIPTYSAITTGLYTVAVSNECGITTIDKYINFNDCNCYLYVPNAFSPDDNGINEYFSPVTDCEVVNYSFRIFNRWGELIFESDSPNKAWTGESNGVPSPSGVYVYVVKYGFSGSTDVEKKYGSVVLLR